MTQTTRRYVIIMQTKTGLWYWAGITDGDTLAAFASWKAEATEALRYQIQSAAIRKAAQLQNAAERLFGPVDVRVEAVGG